MQDGQNTRPSVAIIVPVYNVERYLAECLDSLRAQDYGSWRAVIVDDGSPDGSADIARRYVAEDPRFELVSVPNGGLGSARNVGLEHSESDYVFFVDSDDTIPEGTISALVEAAERTGAAITAGHAEDFGEGQGRTRYWTQRGPLHRRGEITTTATERPDVLDDHVVWNKLYRREHLDRHDLRFPPRVHCEDMVFSARAALLAPTITVIPRLVYRHRRHDAAISASYTRSRTLSDWLDQASRTIQAIAELGDEGALRHYLVRFVKGQWWTRARGVHEIHEDALVSRLQQMSVDIARLLDDEGRGRLGAWHAACLDLFADGEPRFLADAHARAGVNPLEPEGGRTPESVLSILDIVDGLAEDGRASRAFADAILVERVMGAVADGTVPDDAALVDRIAALSERVSTGYLDRFVPPEGAYRARVDRYVIEHGRIASRLLSADREKRGVVLRGTARPTVGARRAQTMTAVIRESGRRPVFAPVTWRRLADADEWRWQCVVPLDDIEPEAPYRIELKAEEDGEPRGRGIAEPDGASLRGIVCSGQTIAFPRAFFLSGGQDRRLFAFPAWRDNPYVISLQMELFARRYGIGGTSDLEAFADEAGSPFRSGVIHVQWPSVVTDEASSAADAERRVDMFVDALRTARSLGRPIVWTVHNVLPHDTEHVDQAVRLHAELAELADVVHVLNSQTAAVAAPFYRIDEEKIVVIPHASYDGVYGPVMDRDEARDAIGASPERTGVLFFGQLRPYKGLDQLVDAVVSLSGRRDDIELILAGKPFPGLEEVLDRIDGAGIPSTRSIGFVPDGDVPQWLSAADVLVLPHRKVLNSGTLYLGATFGVPTILPREDHLVADFGEEPWVRFFDPQRPSESIADLIDDDWYRADEVREAARAFARANPPIEMSRRFARVVEALSAGGAAEAV